MKSLKLVVVSSVLLFLLVGCADETERGEIAQQPADTISAVEESAVVPAILQVVKIKSGLSEEDLLKTAKERAEKFRELPGLLQKYYVRLGAEGEYGGYYFWESREAMMNFRESDLPKTMPEAYKLTEPPSVEVYEVMFQLRE